jgi:hypothetical protein
LSTSAFNVSTYAFVAASVLAVGVATLRIRLDPMSLSKPERFIDACVDPIAVNQAGARLSTYDFGVAEWLKSGYPIFVISPPKTEIMLACIFWQSRRPFSFKLANSVVVIVVKLSRLSLKKSSLS